MASIKQLKKKINKQTFQIIMDAIFILGNQKGNNEELKQFLEEILIFSNKCLFRINHSRGLTTKERKSELRSVKEQYLDKMILFEQKITSA